MMELYGLCIDTDNAPRLAAFYEAVFQEKPVQEGQHYRFEKAQLAVYDPGQVHLSKDKNVSVMYTVPDLLFEYARLRRELSDLAIDSPPKRRPWGAFSFWFLDPDGNRISLMEQKADAPS